jgi:hypothetical protein
VRIGRVSCRGVRGVPDGAWDFSDARGTAPHRLVVLAGRSACGKTRLLEAIFAAKELVAPYAAIPNPASWIRSGSTAAKVAIRWHLDDLEAAHGGLEGRVAETESIFAAGALDPEDDGIVAVLRRYEHGHASGKLEYFPASRSIPMHGVGVGLSAFEQKVLRPTSDARKYASVTRVLRDLAAGGEQASFFGHLLAQLSPTCRFEPTSAVEVTPRCFRAANGHGGGGARTLLELSASEADAVLFAATATLIGLSYSVVLIDRPELHADPSFVPKLLDGLLALGREPQIIVATGSAEVRAAAASRGAVVSLDEPAAEQAPSRGGAAG